MNPLRASDPAGERDVAWASRIVEQLPAADARRLAQAAADGPAAVRALRGRAAAAVLRDACDQLFRRLSGENAAYLAGLLAGAAQAFERARERQHLDVVWTGAETGTGTGCLTAATVIGLIGEARREILIVSYA